MLVLALDTSTDRASVALFDGSAWAAREGEGVNRHGEQLAPLIAELLAEAGASAAQLDRVAVGVGPAPFTGLRVGMMTAVALGHALSIPVDGVVSLDALAAQSGPGPLVVVTDARRKEVYWAGYDAAGVRTEGPDVAKPADLAPRIDSRRIVGPGAALYPDLLPAAKLDAGQRPCADWVGALALAGRTVPVTPLYLRRPDAVEPGPPKPALR